MYDRENLQFTRVKSTSNMVNLVRCSITMQTSVQESTRVKSTSNTGNAHQKQLNTCSH